MPELPEVETVKRGLERTIIGKTVATVDITAPKLFADDRELIDHVLIGAKIVSLERKAKILLIHLSSGWTLAVHLKMTGQLIVVGISDLSDITEVAFVGGHPEKSYEQPLPHKHTHITISFTDGTKLYFNDLRRFGWMRLFPREIKNQNLKVKTETQNVKLQTTEEFIDSLQLGPEPLSNDFTLQYLVRLVSKRSIPIKQLLLEQKGISGIGNIYADEALFQAGVRPTRKATSLQNSEINKLHQAIRTVLEMGIKFGGTSKNTYLQVEGTKGEMQDHLMVYGREGLPCRVCGTLIERIKIGQRSSHYCPNCQK